jgi:hypothetical protein
MSLLVRLGLCHCTDSAICQRESGYRNSQDASGFLHGSFLVWVKLIASAKCRSSSYRDLANSDSSLPENGCDQLRPEIEEEHKNDRNDPAVDHARDKAVDKTACAEQIEVGKDSLQKHMALEVRESQPKDYAQDIDCLEQHAGGEHGPNVGEPGHVHSPPSPLENSLAETNAAP